MFCIIFPLSLPHASRTLPLVVGDGLGSCCLLLRRVRAYRFESTSILIRLVEQFGATSLLSSLLYPPIVKNSAYLLLNEQR